MNPKFRIGYGALEYYFPRLTYQQQFNVINGHIIEAYYNGEWVNANNIIPDHTTQYRVVNPDQV